MSISPRLPGHRLPLSLDSVMSQSAYKQSDLVLVTGANGFIAQHVVDQLLALPAGPRVRATVRSDGTAKQIASFYADNPLAKGRLEVVVIPDIAKPGAFNDAVKSVLPPASVSCILPRTDQMLFVMSGVTHIA
jgi:NAD(P)-dependent dehydrogenase (short-subunit alcohol dehydrogenase family)